MTTQNNDGTNNGDNKGDNNDDDKKIELSPEVQKLVDEEATKRLAPIKANLDKAYQERDELKKKADEAAEKLREAEIKALREAGKEREALEAELKEAKRKADEAQAQVTELSRDSEVRRSLASVKFKTQRAADMAFADIASNLVRNDDGKWYSRTGKSIQDSVSDYVKDPANEFLLEVKPNSGGGSGSGSGRQSDDSNKSVFAMSQEKVFELAAKGQLRRRNR